MKLILTVNGKFINKLINYAIVPIFIFHIFMILDCINNYKIIEAIIVGFILVISIIYYFITYESDYLMAIYSYNKQFDNYQDENNINNISISALNWSSS